MAKKTADTPSAATLHPGQAPHPKSNFIPDKEVAGPTVTITAPTNNSPIVLPYLAKGTATGFAMSSPGVLVGLAYQVTIMGQAPGPLVAISPVAASWQFTLTATDCPTPGMIYSLTVFGGDDQGNLYPSNPVNFFTMS